MPYGKNLYTHSTSVFDAGIIYDQNQSMLQDEFNSAVRDGDVVVGMADNLSSKSNQYSTDRFISRTTGGAASLSDGDGFLVLLRGYSVHTGYRERSVEMSVAPVERTAPPAIAAVINESTFLNAVGSGSGGITFVYSNSWNINPQTYGITVSNVPVSGDRITVTYSYDDSLVSMEVIPVGRTIPPVITATINDDTFLSSMSSESGTFVINYNGTSWDHNPSAYGIAVNNDPVSGDKISVTYAKEVRGTIAQSNPQTFVSTGWNLYNHATGYARVLKYSNVYGFGVSGTYASLAFSSTLTGERVQVAVSNGRFSIEEDGYIWVTGGNNVDTQIWMTWSDWQDTANGGNWSAYSESIVDFSSIMAEYFPYGLLRVGSYQDEIDFSNGLLINNVGRISYSISNFESIKALGTDYEYDEDYIYYGLSSPITNTFSISNDYSAFDHGLEFFTNTTVEVYTQTLYGINLKNRLERDVVTISQQSFTDSEYRQLGFNLGRALYPVGSIYMSTNSTSPAALFGGVWERITGKFLLAATDGGATGGNSNASIAPGYTGGEASHVITTAEMAAHTHNARSVTGGFNIRAYNSGSTVNTIMSAWGCMSITTNAWSGTHDHLGKLSVSGASSQTLNYSATHTHDSVGSNAAHNTMPPYLAVYIWKRTA